MFILQHVDGCKILLAPPFGLYYSQPLFCRHSGKFDTLARGCVEEQ